MSSIASPGTGWKSYFNPIMNLLSKKHPPHACSFSPQPSLTKPPFTKRAQNKIYKLHGHQCVPGGTSCWYAPSSYACSRAVCRTCLDLEFHLYPESDEHAKFLYSDCVSSHDPLKRRFILTSMGNIRDCAAKCCHKCAVLLEGVERMCINLGDFLPRIERDREAVDELDAVRISLRANGTVIVEFSNWTIEFYTPLDSPLLSAAFGVAKPMPLSPSIEYCSAFIQANLQHCKDQHNQCQPSDPTLPSRVLDVGTHLGSQRVRLIETSSLQSDKASYFALSHCWGPPASIPQTTQSTFTAYLKEIPWADLPKSFTDAISLTQAMQIRYLWIDSLCIKQDDAKDWEIESSQMASIYANSELVIAAAGASDSSVGCLFNRWPNVDIWIGEPGPEPHSDIEIETCIDGITSTVIARQIPIAAHEDTSFKGGSYYASAALAKRAWVFQERVLAPRTVHFHHQELVWECRSTTSCECGQLTGPIDNARGKTLKALFNGQQNNDLDLELYHRTWIEVVGTFSQLQITYESDRLPALAGLASCFSASTGSDYLAGLWKTDLPRSLLWKTGAYQTNTRSPSPRPPTWSWASLVTGISTSTQRADGVVFELGLYVTAVFVQDPRVTVLGAECTPLGDNKFGRVSCGWIRLQGPLLAVAIISEEYPGQYQIVFDGVGSSFLPDISDEDHLVYEENSVFCLLIGGMRDAQCQVANSYQYGLVLKKVDDDHYERLGRMAIDPSKQWFTNAPVREVILV